jgi:hypothetical protein
MKKSTSVELISALLILLFTYTAVSKLINFENFQLSIGEVALIRPYATFLSIIVPTVEILIVILLLRFRQWGLYSSFALMLTFTLYVVYVIYFSPKTPCSCGGIIRQMNWKQHLTFNIIFTVLALLGSWLNKRAEERDVTPNLNYSSE